MSIMSTNNVFGAEFAEQSVLIRLLLSGKNGVDWGATASSGRRSVNMLAPRSEAE